jgi:hypothetical protein
MQNQSWSGLFPNTTNKKFDHAKKVFFYLHANARLQVAIVPICENHFKNSTHHENPTPAAPKKCEPLHGDQNHIMVVLPNYCHLLRERGRHPNPLST